jgi:superfamily II DNA or RNA helicase
MSAVPAIPEIDFSADPEAVRLVAEAHRLSYGHLANPGFAAEVSLIDPLPHQRIAVYDHILNQRPLRFVLADDAGAGKTIMTGLYIREMLSRRLLRRVLVVPPAGLVSNWRRELATLFGLRARVITGADASRASGSGDSPNPFRGPGSDLAIVSVDTLAGQKVFSRLAEPGVEPYDLVVFDEAHKLAARQDPDGGIVKTDRYSLAEALAGVKTSEPRFRLDWHARNLLLLTATPHMGKDFPYYCLWRLLEPEALATFEAFSAYPPAERRHHFLRRTKEEMVDFSGRPLYPPRHCDTVSYELTQGGESEQELYDETTKYISSYYNRARLLNRTAVRLAMSVFQRRLASSTYALMRSFERRLEKLEAIMDDLRSGRLTADQLLIRQRRLDSTRDLLDEATADEEGVEHGEESSEAAERNLLGGVVAVNLAELEVEKAKVAELLDLARRVAAKGSGAKFERLLEVLGDVRFAEEKFLIFTEHRDTMDFIARRLEALGYTGQVARIHGGLDAAERDRQIEFFRAPAGAGGARFMVCTDAAGEGINLQFCWLMVNYDIPWNPARLEQRMGRIHRYLQTREVRIINLVAGNTREGRVLKTLLDKLQLIRERLGSDKVFDVVGRLFEGVSLREYMEMAVTEAGVEAAARFIEGRLTPEQVEALEARERLLYGDRGDVKRELPALKDRLEQEGLRRLLPGYVRHFVLGAAPVLDLALEGPVDGRFTFRPLRPGALDPFLPASEAYPPDWRTLFTIERPAREEKVVFLRPGEPFFESLREAVASRLEGSALRGGVFTDPHATGPYLFHLALVSVVRRRDPADPGFAEELLLEERVVGVRQDESGNMELCPIEHLLLLRGAPGALPVGRLAAVPLEYREQARRFAMTRVAEVRAEDIRERLRLELARRREAVRQGYDYRLAELGESRVRLRKAVSEGDRRAAGELEAVKREQERVTAEAQAASRRLEREPDLVAPGEVRFLAHALVLPSADSEDQAHHDARVEALAMEYARRYEEDLGAVVKDVSTADRAREAGLGDRPGFDLLSRRPDGQELCIEVKGRAHAGEVEVTRNEWAQACNLGPRYWLYVVYDCATRQPRLRRIQDPFSRLLARTKGSVLISEAEIAEAAEG